MGLPFYVDNSSLRNFGIAVTWQLFSGGIYDRPIFGIGIAVLPWQLLLIQFGACRFVCKYVMIVVRDLPFLAQIRGAVCDTL